MFDDYDFIDFGCSMDENIRFTHQVLPDSRGVGIDIDERKLERAREPGCDVVNFDILKIRNFEQVSLVTMSHFMELSR